MATFWLSDAGNDANDGTSYAQAKATLSAAIALLSQGDTLNCVGSFSALSPPGTVDGNTLRGTSYADPACIIRGTDPEGNPAFCTVTAPDTLSRYWLETANRPDYLIVRGFIFDYALTLNAAGWAIRTSGSGQFPMLVEYCQIFGIDDSQFFYRPHLVHMAAAASGFQAPGPATCDVRFCYLRDSQVWGDNTFRVSAYRCVFRYTQGRLDTDVDINAPLVNQDTNTTNRGAGVHAVNCTVDMDFKAPQPRPAPIFSDYYNGINERVNAAHSNLICVASDNPTEVGQTYAVQGVISSGADASGTFTGVVGYNAFLFDAQLQAALTNTVTSLPNIYSQQFNPGYPGTTSGTNLYPTDHRLDNAVVGDVVNTTAPWTWENVDGSGYDILLEKDYRVVNSTLTTAAYDGGPVGAITELTNTPPVIEGDQNWTVTAGDTISVDASSGLAEMSFDPDGDPLTWSVVDNVTHGTLNLVTNTGAYEYTPNITYTGNDSFTWQVCDAVTCEIHILDSDQRPSVVFYVEPYPVVPPDGDATVPPVFLDVLPFFAPDLRVDALVRYTSKRNSLPYKTMDGRAQNERWTESTHRVIQLATNTTHEVNLGGIETARHLVIESDGDVEVSVNTTTAYWPMDGVAAIINTQVQSLHVRNTSTADEATVHIIAVD